MARTAEAPAFSQRKIKLIGFNPVLSPEVPRLSRPSPYNKLTQTRKWRMTLDGTGIAGTIFRTATEKGDRDSETDPGDN